MEHEVIFTSQNEEKALEEKKYGKGPEGSSYVKGYDNSFWNGK